MAREDRALGLDHRNTKDVSLFEERMVPRQDLTGADPTWAERYEVGDALLYSRASKETGIGRGEYAPVKSINWAG
jgi:hypothetical protein